MTTGGINTKDLQIFGNRQLDNIVIVDNSSYNFIWKIDNGILITPFFDNKNDQELKLLE
jgi:TFIIF-interacting CTD phosphatase-like protein